LTGHRAFFSFRNRCVEVVSHDPSVVARLSRLIDLPFAGHGVADCSIALAEEAGRFVIRIANTTKFYGTLADAVAALAQSVPFWLLPFGEAYALHAGAIIAGGRAHVVLAPGHVGKSTLALEAWLQGYDVLGDDYLLFDPQALTLEAVPKPVKLRLADGTLPERLRAHLAPDTYCLGRGEDGWTLILGRNLPRMIAITRNFPIASIHLLSRSKGETVSRPADKRAFFQAALAQTVVAPKNGLDVLRAFRPLLDAGRIFSLRVGHNDAARAVETMIAAAPCAGFVRYLP
jgi:hypothetical protein